MTIGSSTSRLGEIYAWLILALNRHQHNRQRRIVSRLHLQLQADTADSPSTCLITPNWLLILTLLRLLTYSILTANIISASIQKSSRSFSSVISMEKKSVVMDNRNNVPMDVYNMQKAAVKVQSKKKKRKRIKLRCKAERKHQKRLRAFIKIQYARKSVISKALARNRKNKKKVEQTTEQIIVDLSALKMSE